MRSLVLAVALPVLLGAAAPAGCTVTTTDTGTQADFGGPEEACASYQYVELYEAQDGAQIFRVDLDNVQREQTPRIEACVYSVAWTCEPCDVGLYATAYDLEPYPEGAQAWVRGCSTEPVVTYRVTHTLCGEE